MPPDGPSLKLEGASKRAADISRSRLGWIAIAFSAAFAVLAGRMVQVSVWPAAEPRTAARAQDLAALRRADLTDRNGAILATDLDAASLFADTRQVWDAEEVADGLSRVLPSLDREALLKKLRSGQAFVWLQRDLSPRQQADIHRLGFPALGFRKEPHRVYPYGRLAAHALGTVDTDNRGSTGLERGLDARLTGGSEPVALTLDVRAQHALQDELIKAMATFQAIAATGLVMDVRTGELVAIASLPDFDPNDPMAAPAEARFNSATLGRFEMGSTFKTFTTAMVLDAGKATLASTFDARRPLTFGRFKISDFHAQNRVLTTAEVFEHSSNIGSARMALSVGVAGHQAFLRKLGLMEPLSFEILETGAPLLPRKWGDLQSVTISYGHGMAVNPVQLAAAAAAMVNGGILHQPTLTVRAPSQRAAGTPVISAKTSAIMRDLLRRVVTHGTGGKADVPGYPVGGKTGTAEKPKHGSYAESALLSSFLAVFPAHEPQYLVLVILDEPKPTPETHGFATAGWTAAPTTGKVIRRIAPLLNVAVTPGAIPQFAETRTVPAQEAR
jgi:cell division protein FtsI (penicillin-binding protein 3)